MNGPSKPLTLFSNSARLEKVLVEIGEFQPLSANINGCYKFLYCVVKAFINDVTQVGGGG